MFNNGSRYATKGVMEEVGLDVQSTIWNIIEELGKSKKLDYLQVFECSVDMVKNEAGELQRLQKIIHKQEVPRYKKLHHFKVENPIQCKIFVIDSEEYSTILLAEEY